MHLTATPPLSRRERKSVGARGQRGAYLGSRQTRRGWFECGLGKREAALPLHRGPRLKQPVCVVQDSPVVFVFTRIVFLVAMTKEDPTN